MACEWGAWCLGRWEGTGLLAWRAAVVARRLCGCLTAGWDARAAAVQGVSLALGFLLLCLLDCGAGA